MHIIHIFHFSCGFEQTNSTEEKHEQQHKHNKEAKLEKCHFCPLVTSYN